MRKEADVVVIGGSAAGLTAALTARRHYPQKSILIIRREEQVLIPCGIPYIFGTVGTPQNNLIPDAVLDKNNIDLLIGEVTEIDPERNEVRLASGDTASYAKLVLATGSRPLVPPIPGADKDNVFPIRKDPAYMGEILRAVNKASDVVVLGCGFIGVEFADECRKNRDVHVTIVEMLSQCLQVAFGEQACRCCEEIETALETRGIDIVTEVRLEEVIGDGKVSGIRLSDGRELPADVLVLGVGVRPNVDLAREAGLDTTEDGIAVDANMRTSATDIFACGDCAAKRSFFTGQPTQLRLASVAAHEARIAGANLFGIRRKNPGAVGVFSTAIGDLAVGMAGMSPKGAVECGFVVVTGEAEAPNRHPGGMPGMARMWVRLVFNRVNGELVGGTVCGGTSAGELINTISACIQNRTTADDIATFQTGTHPALTASPIAYQLVNAAEDAITAMNA